MHLCIIPVSTSKVPSGVSIRNSTNVSVGTSYKADKYSDDDTWHVFDKNNNEEEMVWIEENSNWTEMQQTCQAFDIADVNCTCEMYPVLCSNQNKTAIPVVFSCSNITDKIEGSVIIISFFGIIGDFLVTIVMLKDKRNMENFKKLILMLAFPNFALAFTETITAIPKLWTCKWLYTKGMWKLFHGLFCTSRMVSIGLIVIIALKRYWGILYPLKRSFLKRHI